LFHLVLTLLKMQSGLHLKLYHTHENILKKRKLSVGVGDEGGFSPNLENNEEALKLIVEAIGEANYKLGKEIFLALDSAASSFHKDGKYLFEGKKVGSSFMIDYYEKLIDKYPIISLEDPLSEDDYEGWKDLTKKLKDKIFIIGDDIFVTK